MAYQIPKSVIQKKEERQGRWVGSVGRKEQNP